MKELLDRLKGDLQDEEARYAYADSIANAFISAQIKSLREDRKLSQEKLAELIGTKQSGISRLERADYSSWKVETLRKLAKAFGVRFVMGFAEFGTLPQDLETFKNRLQPRKFEDDPVFKKQEQKEDHSSQPREIPDDTMIRLSSETVAGVTAVVDLLAKSQEQIQSAFAELAQLLEPVSQSWKEMGERISKLVIAYPASLPLGLPNESTVSRGIATFMMSGQSSATETKRIHLVALKSADQPKPADQVQVAANSDIEPSAQVLRKLA